MTASDPASPASPAAPFAPAALAALVRTGVVDGELGALLWLLVAARTPVVVAGAPGSGRSLVADALRDALPAGAGVRTVDPRDEFAWMPEAVELGWRSVAPGRGRAPDSLDAATGVLLVRDLADEAADGVTGERARIVVRALAVGYGMIATMPGRRLEDVLEHLNGPAVGTDEDERSRLGVVLVLGERVPGGPVPARVVAAHYVRPIAYDTHHHVQRLPPAALATWNERSGRWDHFAWGVLADLGGRTGLRPVAFEREQAARAAALVALASC